MNKAQFVSTLKSWAELNNVDLNECHVSHGGSMLMLGLREETDDVDLTVSQNIWDRLIAEGYQSTRLPATGSYPEIQIIAVTDEINVHNDPITGFTLEVFDGIWYRDAQSTISDKMRLNRPKDQADIKTLKASLNTV